MSPTNAATIAPERLINPVHSPPTRHRFGCVALTNRIALRRAARPADVLGAKTLVHRFAPPSHAFPPSPKHGRFITSHRPPMRFHLLQRMGVSSLRAPLFACVFTRSKPRAFLRQTTNGWMRCGRPSPTTLPRPSASRCRLKSHLKKRSWWYADSLPRFKIEVLFLTAATHGPCVPSRSRSTVRGVCKQHCGVAAGSALRLANHLGRLPSPVHTVLAVGRSGAAETRCVYGRCVYLILHDTRCWSLALACRWRCAAAYTSVEPQTPREPRQPLSCIPG